MVESPVSAPKWPVMVSDPAVTGALPQIRIVRGPYRLS
jgi:hypothetical protein